MSKSTKWFLLILGILALFAIGFTLIVILVTGVPAGTTVTSGTGDRIALVEITGVIVSSEGAVRQIKSYRENSSIQALLIRVNSPGGGVVASQEIYEEVRKTRESGKPVVVSMGGVAASGGYYIACGASKIVANRGTITGSVGAIMEVLQYYEGLEKLGIAVKTIKSGEAKDTGSRTREMNERDRKRIQDIVDDVYRQFMGVVTEERGLDARVAELVAKGGIFSGEQAVELGLVDTVGTFEDAKMIAAELAGIEGEPAIVKERKRSSWLSRWLGEASVALTGVQRELLERPVLSYRYPGP
ncbi:MAG: signal peptide peptidase SppA [Bacteroidetes bacterium]|nr:signal peptide peptidase SppA [Bacteroidota bacterium]